MGEGEEIHAPVFLGAEEVEHRPQRLDGIVLPAEQVEAGGLGGEAQGAAQEEEHAAEQAEAAPVDGIAAEHGAHLRIGLQAAPLFGGEGAFAVEVDEDGAVFAEEFHQTAELGDVLMRQDEDGVLHGISKSGSGFQKKRRMFPGKVLHVFPDGGSQGAG